MPETAPAGGGAGPARLRAVAEAIEREFPLAARQTLLRLFDLDPDQLQAQWQVEAERLVQARGAFPVGLTGVRPRLRLLRPEAGAAAREVAALSLPDDAASLGGVARFLAAGGPGVFYQAELGLASPEGGWVLLARSNLASLPPAPRLNLPPGRERGPGAWDRRMGPAPAVRPESPRIRIPDAGPAVPPTPAPTLARTPELTPQPDLAPSPSPIPTPELTLDPTLAAMGLPLHPVFPQPVSAASRPAASAWASRSPVWPRQGEGLKAIPLVIVRDQGSPPDRRQGPPGATPPADPTPFGPPAAVCPGGEGALPCFSAFDPRGTRSSLGARSSQVPTSPGPALGADGLPDPAGSGAHLWRLEYSQDPESPVRLMPLESRPSGPDPA